MPIHSKATYLTNALLRILNASSRMYSFLEALFAPRFYEYRTIRREVTYISLLPVVDRFRFRFRFLFLFLFLFRFLVVQVFPLQVLHYRQLRLFQHHL